MQMLTDDCPSCKRHEASEQLAGLSPAMSAHILCVFIRNWVWERTLRPNLQLTSRPILELTLLGVCMTRPLTLHSHRGQLDSAVQTLIPVGLWMCNVVLAAAADFLEKLHCFASHHIAGLQGRAGLQQSCPGTALTQDVNNTTYKIGGSPLT